MGSVNRRSWHSCGVSNTGNVRSINEDAYLEHPRQGIWLVADGMGGHSAGDVASRMIVEELRNYTSTPLLGRNIQQIIERLQQVNDRLVGMAADDPDKIIGSTFAALLLHRNHYICLWVGDSRVYRYRRGILKQITRDHSELDNLLDNGVTMEEAMRSPFAQAITRAVGASDKLMVESQIAEIQEDDVFLLCSDGLNKELSDPEIAAILAQHPPESSVEIMLQMALQRRGQDNITIMTVYPEPDR